MADPEPYSSIDAAIQDWARANRLLLFHEFAGQEARFCYISSAKGECFQISIQPPKDANVSVDVWSIETSDDRELHQNWTAPVRELPGILDAALKTVHRLLEAG